MSVLAHAGGVSSLNAHRACPQRWYNSYELGLEQNDGARDARVWLTLGSWWSALRMADSIERGRAAGSLRSTPDTEAGTVDGWHTVDQRTVTVSEVLDSLSAWWEARRSTIARHGDEPQTVEQVWIETLDDDPVSRIAAMDALWRQRWGATTETERVIAAEVEWSRPLADGISLRGKVDEIVFSDALGGIVIRDHKTNKAFRDAGPFDDFFDSQGNVYAWGVADLLREWGEGVPAYVQYDRVRSKKPSTPALTKAGGLSKAVTDYDLTTYLAWCAEGVAYEGLKKDGSGAGTYTADPKVIETLSGEAAQDAWTRRSTSLLNVNVLRSHLIAAKATSEAAEATRALGRENGGIVPRNYTRMGCATCPFVELCRDQMIGGPDGIDYANYGLTRSNA